MFYNIAQIITKSINNADISSHWFEVIGVVSQQPYPLSSQIRQLLAGLSLSKLKILWPLFMAAKATTRIQFTFYHEVSWGSVPGTHLIDFARMKD